MSMYSQDPQQINPLVHGAQHELDHLKKDWWWLLILGIGMVVLGTIAISCSFSTTLVAMKVCGLLLIVAGIGQIVTAFWTGRWGGFLLHLFAGILYGFLGLLFINEPLSAAAVVTMMMAAMFMVTGVFRIVAALTERFAGWGWPLLSGIVSLLLGLMIYKQWPQTSLFLPGLFIGIELIFNGFAWAMLALGLRSLVKPNTVA